MFDGVYFHNEAWTAINNRHANDTTTNLLMFDGHAESVKDWSSRPHKVATDPSDVLPDEADDFYAGTPEGPKIKVQHGQYQWRLDLVN